MTAGGSFHSTATWSAFWYISLAARSTLDLASGMFFPTPSIAVLRDSSACSQKFLLSVLVNGFECGFFGYVVVWL